MKLNKKTLLLVAAGLLGSSSSHAATALKEGFYFVFDRAASSHEMTIKSQSWYNPTMGYTGWTHHSNWGFMTLKKGKPVSIEVATNIAGLHPAVTVWHRPSNKKIEALFNMADHFYSQYLDVYEPNAFIDDDPNNPIKIGEIWMKFVANAFDRDGMADPLPAQFDKSQLTREVDGEPGKVTLTFTPEADGYYQFAVGAINPDEGVSSSLRHPVQVYVNFPE